MKRNHWIVLVKKSEVDNANTTLAALFGKEWAETFTIDLYDSREYKMRRWCGVNLTAAQKAKIEDAFAAAGISAEWYLSADWKAGQVLARVKLHRKKEPEAIPDPDPPEPIPEIPKKDSGTKSSRKRSSKRKRKRKRKTEAKG